MVSLAHFQSKGICRLVVVIDRSAEVSGRVRGFLVFDHAAAVAQGSEGDGGNGVVKVGFGRLIDDERVHSAQVQRRDMYNLGIIHIFILIISQNHIIFEIPGTRVISRLIDGEYFNVDQMISSDYDNGLIGDCLLYDDKGILIIDQTNIVMFGLVNALFSAILFFVFSMIYKWKSKTVKYYPF